MQPRKNKILVLDTECVGLANKSVYDIGYTITDKKGNICQERTFIVEEVYTDPDAMLQAYFSDRVFTYYPYHLNITNMLLPWDDIVEILRDDIRTNNVTTVSAYNLGFDMQAIKHTQNMLCDVSIPVLPHKPDNLLCLWEFACRVLLSRPTFKSLAHEHGWISKAGNIRTTAEHAYRYITGNYSFDESHTALEDAQIETEILAKCFAQKRKVPYNIINRQPWRIVNI